MKEPTEQDPKGPALQYAEHQKLPQQERCILLKRYFRLRERQTMLSFSILGISIVFITELLLVPR